MTGPHDILQQIQERLGQGQPPQRVIEDLLPRSRPYPTA
jgi:hypothetical protein